MYEEIKQIIKNKKSDIDDETLTYFTNYFYVAKKRGVIPSKIELESLIDNALEYASKIVFFEEDSEITKKEGKDIKGFPDAKTRTIYIRENLPDDLREIIVYHELHHAVQTNPLNNKIGINQAGDVGTLIMEAQTQYFAEVIYEEIHGVKFEDREIPSENLRMLPGGTVISKLHNYEMYDCMLSKLAIALEVDKDFFVRINYLGANDEGLNILKNKYDEANEKYKFPYDFYSMLFYFDYIYVVDVKAYASNPDKETILSGRETEKTYPIWPNYPEYKLSLGQQKAIIDYFDICFVDCLYKNAGNYLDFSKYIIDNQNRNIINDYLEKVGARNK